jgi:NAD(P)-dependent dehydrogenase (short-subunit alcohol dehydrogenase family)
MPGSRYSASHHAKTEDGLEQQFEVNQLAHFLLFNLLKQFLLPSLTQEFNSRVVMVSSPGHRVQGILAGEYDFREFKYAPGNAHGQSKTANIFMANKAQDRPTVPNNLRIKADYQNSFKFM